MKLRDWLPRDADVGKAVARLLDAVIVQEYVTAEGDCVIGVVS